MTIDRMIELLEIEHECMLRKSHDDCDSNCADCELAQDDGELHEMYTNVIENLKNQRPVDVIYDGDCNWYKCSNCGCVLNDDWWCPLCGRKVKWE